MSKVNSELARALGKPAAELADLEVLKAPAQKQLLTDIEAARKVHARHIKASLEEALNHIPRLLRGPIRKIFGV